MGAVAVVPVSGVAVGAQHPKLVFERVSALLECGVERVAARLAPEREPVGVAAAVDVVDVEKSHGGLSTASAYPTIGFHDLAADAPTGFTLQRRQPLALLGRCLVRGARVLLSANGATALFANRRTTVEAVALEVELLPRLVGSALRAFALIGHTLSITRCLVFCWLFGAMSDLPKGFPMYCKDIKQWADDLGNPKLPEQSSSEHNALADARWNREAWNYLSTVAAGGKEVADGL